jgi:hypothetical protein
MGQGLAVIGGEIKELRMAGAVFCYPGKDFGAG